jgi:hypothetical protein
MNNERGGHIRWDNCLGETQTRCCHEQPHLVQFAEDWN